MEASTSPERSHVAPVNSREELIYLLSRASELEHGLACVYLFAAYSLKSDASEGGLTEDQAAMVRRWRRSLASVAVEEMLHLAQVSNILTAIGGAPHFKRTNFPLPSSAFPFGLRLSLEPFSQDMIERFVCYEMPEAGVLAPDQEAVYARMLARIVALEGGDSVDEGEGGAPLAVAEAETSCEPFDIDFKTVGEFYHKIETGLNAIPERELFIGPPEAQANARFLDVDGELVTVVDRASACAGINMIVEQGEAPSAAHPDAHFVVFDEIRKEFEAAVAEATASGTVFQPVRPVVPNPMTRFYDDTSGGTVIADPPTHAVADLCNVAYDTMLLMLLRFFAHTNESAAELEHVSRGTLRLMTTVIRPLGDGLAKMPLGDARLPGKTAGAGFGYNRDVQLLPHKESAWVFFGERLRELASIATQLHTETTLPTEVQEAAAALEDLAWQFAPTARISNATTGPAEVGAIVARERRTIQPELNGPYLVSYVEHLANSKGERLDALRKMALCRCGGSKNKPFCDGTHARIDFASHKLPARVPDRRDTYEAGEVTIYDNRGICQHSGFCTDGLPAVFRVDKEPFVNPHAAPGADIIAQVWQCPSGALSHAVGGVELRDNVRDPTIIVSKDGPYRVTGGIELQGAAWGEGASREHYALCRCGGSKNKPFCDGTHWYNNFKDEKN